MQWTSVQTCSQAATRARKEPLKSPSTLLLFLALCLATSTAFAKKSIKISTPFSSCSAFAIVNKPNSDQDILLTAAHCLDIGELVLPMVSGEGGEMYVALYVGVPMSPHDLAILKGPVPDDVEELKLAAVPPALPSDAEFYGFNIEGSKKTRLFAFDKFGDYLGKGTRPEPGNSGGPLLVDGEVVGITFAYEDKDVGVFVPLHEIYLALAEHVH